MLKYNIYTNIYVYIYYESQLGSWLVVICERSENRGLGGGSCLEGARRGQIGGKNGGPEDAF